MASPAFWCIYLDPLFALMRKQGVGCHVAGLYVGVVGYADDLLLLAPNREAAQVMLKICEDFAVESNISFSTDPDPKRSKCKALYVVGPRGAALPRPAPLRLCGSPLPWVERAEHLGHALHQDGTMRQDCRERRAQFIDTSSRIREAFSFAHPVEQILAVEKYCTAVYGSSLWDLGGQEAGMMVSAWRTGHKLAWDVPRNCHTYLVDEVLTVGVANLEASLLLRFHGFFQGLIASPSHEVAVVALLAARDQRSTLGSNLTRLQNLTGLDPWVAGRCQVKAALQLTTRREVPELDFWRPMLLQKLLSTRLEAHYSADKEEEERIATLITSLVTG